MFQIEVAPDAVCQLEHLTLQYLEMGGRADAYRFLQGFELCIASLRENPVDGSTHMKGIPRRYRVRNILPEIFVLYQIDEETAHVRIDALIKESAEISN